MFYGRNTKLYKLNKLFDKKEHQCVIIYGRRRVGKTTLISEFCKGKRTLFFSAIESTARKNLSVFSNALNEFLNPDSLVSATYNDFDAIFTKIVEIANEEQFVFVIDEFPYLAKSYPAISSTLQHLINHKLSKTNIYMIICGSSMSFMENQILGYQSPLYGRRSAQFKLEPLD